MGRYYNTTATPQFIEGMYTPPWELINKSLESNQQGYENILSTTNLFNDVDIQHIEDPIIKEQAEKLKNYYSQRADEITGAIQKDPTAWKRATPEIQRLGKDLEKDMKSGEISRLNQQYQSLASFVKEHEQYKKDHPEDYNRALSYFMQDFQSDPLRRKSFNWFQLAKPVDDTKFKEGLLKLKASSMEQSTKDGYIVGSEGVPREQIEAYTRSFLSNPENKAYIQQQIRFKNPDYYDAEYEKLHPETGGFYENLVIDPETGRILSDEEIKKIEKEYKVKKNAYDKLSDKKKLETIPPRINYQIKKGAVSKYIDDAVSTASYTKTTLKEDPVKAKAKELAQEMAIAQMNNSTEIQQMESTERIAKQTQAVSGLKTLQTAISSLESSRDKVTGLMTPENQARYNTLKEKETEALNAMLNIAINADTNTKTTLHEMQTPTMEGSKGGGKGVFSMVPQNEQKDYIDYGNVPRTAILTPPTNIYDLARKALSRNDIIGNNLYQGFKEQVNSKISKIENSNSKNLAKDFVKYVENIASKNLSDSRDLNELLTDFVTLKVPTEKSKIAYGMASFISNPNPKGDYVLRRQELLRDLKKSIVPLFNQFEKAYTQVGKKPEPYNVEVYPLVPDVSEKLSDVILEDPSAWNIYPKDAEGRIDLNRKPVGTNSGTIYNLKHHKAKATHTVSGILSKGSTSSAILIRDGGYEYIAVPNDKKYEGFIQNTLNSNTVYKGQPTSYEKIAQQSLAKDITNNLQVAATFTDSAGNPYKSIELPDKGLKIKQTTIQVEGKPKKIYDVFKDGESIFRGSVDDIFDKEQYNVGKGVFTTLEEGLASKIEKFLK